VPPASLSTFDAPDREKCTARRGLTNTPLQALVLMNDPTYVEAARALAERVLKETGDAARLDLAFRRALARTPKEPERRVLLSGLRRLHGEFAARPEDAKKLLKVGESKRDESLDPVEHAAWTSLCLSILNLDEAVTRE